MALIDRLFPSQRKQEDESRKSRDRSRCHRLNEEQVRLLLFKECERRGRRLLFDSSTIARVTAAKDDRPNVKKSGARETPRVVEVSNGFSYVYNGPAADAGSLGEMIFGAVAINDKGVSFKIHIMKEPRRLMCTKLFSVPSRLSRDRRTSVADRSDPSIGRSDPTISRSGSAVGRSDPTVGRSGSLSVPTARDVSLSFSVERGDSGFYGEQSLASISSDGFPAEDWRSADDLYALHYDGGARRGGGSRDSQVYSNSSCSGTSDSLNSAAPPPRRHRLGLALLLTAAPRDDMDIIRCCAEHSRPLHALVCRLRRAVMAAGADGRFIATLHDATRDAAVWLSDLMYGPRLQSAWLGLNKMAADKMAGDKMADKMADRIVADLCCVLDAGDTKHTNFFVSTLLTHVLTYHLGWVRTVSPYGEPDPTRPADRPTRPADRPTRPADALQSQLADLCGAVGHPTKSAQTVVSGSGLAFVDRLLSVLTYFVRCSEVTRHSVGFSSDVSAGRVVSVGDRLKRSATRRDIGESVRRATTTLNLCDATDDGAMCSRTEASEPGDVSEKPDSKDSVVFVLGDNERLVGLKNKSNDGRRVKKSSKSKLDAPVDAAACHSQSPSKCCGQTLQHSKPIKHSGFKFEFDKYPQIVTHYMKSKNLEILDRHYIGKPGNLKLDNYQFDPTIVPPIQEERCEACYKCQMDVTLQTPTNASEFEYMNDTPRLSEPQYAKEMLVAEDAKVFRRERKRNTVLVNVALDPTEMAMELRCGASGTATVRTAIEFPIGRLDADVTGGGYEATLLGGVTDHYVSDLVLQGTTLPPRLFEAPLRRDLALADYLRRAPAPAAPAAPAVAIVGDTDTWEVSVLGRDAGAFGMSALVAHMLDAVPHLRRARAPAALCLAHLEGKLRELCVLSKALAEILMSTDFCDIATLTRSLNVDINDVPLLLAVATTHTPEVARRYGISYR